jgi:hypothetical protein
MPTTCWACLSQECSDQLEGVESGSHAIAYLHGFMAGMSGQTPVWCETHTEAANAMHTLLSYLEMPGGGP